MSKPTDEILLSLAASLEVVLSHYKPPVIITPIRAGDGGVSFVNNIELGNGIIAARIYFRPKYDHISSNTCFVVCLNHGKMTASLSDPGSISKITTILQEYFSHYNANYQHVD